MLPRPRPLRKSPASRMPTGRLAAIGTAPLRKTGTAPNANCLAAGPCEVVLLGATPTLQLLRAEKCYPQRSNRPPLEKAFAPLPIGDGWWQGCRVSRHPAKTNTTPSRLGL